MHYRFLFTEILQDALELTTARKAVVQAILLGNVEIPFSTFRAFGHIV
jgi:hypothetical protein